MVDHSCDPAPAARLGTWRTRMADLYIHLDLDLYKSSPQHGTIDLALQHWQLWK